MFNNDFPRFVSIVLYNRVGVRAVRHFLTWTSWEPAKQIKGSFFHGYSTRLACLGFQKQAQRDFFTKLNIQETYNVLFCVHRWSLSSFAIFLNHLPANSFLIKITHDWSDESVCGQSESLCSLYKYQYFSNASFVCDGLFTIYRQDKIIKLFSNLMPIRTNLPPNLNKDFIEPPCTEDVSWSEYCDVAIYWR